MTIDDIKRKEDRLGEMFLVYYRQLNKMDEEYKKFEQLKNDLTVLAAEIEEDYLTLSKEQENGEKLC